MKTIAALLMIFAMPLVAYAGTAVPDGAALEPLLELVQDFGRNSPDGALIVWTGYDSIGPLRPRDAAGVYLYGNGTVHLRLEEWTALPDGRYRILIWKFYFKTDTDHASVTELIRDSNKTGIINIPRYEEPIALHSSEAAEKAEKAIRVLLGADRETLKRLPADIYTRPFMHHGQNREVDI